MAQQMYAGQMKTVDLFSVPLGYSVTETLRILRKHNLQKLVPEMMNYLSLRNLCFDGISVTNCDSPEFVKLAVRGNPFKSKA